MGAEFSAGESPPSTQALHGSARRSGWIYVVLAIAFVLRLIGIGRESFWFDETIAAFLSQTSLGDILSMRADDGGNPQGFWLAGHVWGALAGTSDVALRMLPLVFGVVCVAVVYIVARELGGRRLALATAALLAINPNHIYLSQEYRVYTLMQLLSLVAVVAAYRYDRTLSNRALGLYVAAATAGFYSHYYAALAVCTANLWMLRRWREWPVLLRWCAAQVVVLALIAPVIVQAMGHTSLRVHASGGGAASKLHLAATPLTVLFGRTLAWKDDGLLWFAACLAGATLLLAAALWCSFQRHDMAPDVKRLLWMWIVVPLAAAAGLAIFGDMQSWDDRKALAVMAPVLMLVASGLLSARPAIRTLLIGAIVLASSIAWARYLAADNRDQWRELAAMLNADAKAGDALVVIPDFELFSLDRYLVPRLAGGASGLNAFGYRVTGEFATLGPLGVRSAGWDVPSSLSAASRVWVVHNRLLPGGGAEKPLELLGMATATPLASRAWPRDLAVTLFEKSTPANGE